MNLAAAWRQELERPTESFFPALAALLGAPGGAEEATRQAIAHLVPRVDWEGHLPQLPHGLLGLRSVFRLREHLSEPSFRRLLATQLHAFAHEPRRPESKGLGRLGTGSGHWPNLTMAVREHRPAIAWGEASAIPDPGPADYQRLRSLVAGDMANVGHKAVLIHHLEEIAARVAVPPELNRLLLALAAWYAATEPSDAFWNARVRKRLEGWKGSLPEGPAALSGSVLGEGSRELCDLGLVGALDAFTHRMKEGAGQVDLLTILALAAAEKQLDARRDLEGKTAWNFVYLAVVPVLGGPEPWGQAAALVNFFPSDEPEARVQARLAGAATEETPVALLDAVLDAEADLAMGLAAALFAQNGEAAVLGVLAEAASRNDPGLHHSHTILAVAAAADLMPRLNPLARPVVLQALAKSLANSPGSDELGRWADRALAQG